MPRHVPDDALASALEAGDLPVAAHWLARLDGARDLLERGVLRLEALSDPLFDDPAERAACIERLIEDVEDGLAIGDADARQAHLVLAMMCASPTRFGLAHVLARLVAIARMAGAGTLTGSQRERYEAVRRELAARPAPRATDAAWRLDRDSGVIREGKDVTIDARTAIAIAELRAAAAGVCRTIAEGATAPLIDPLEDASLRRREIRCSERVLDALRTYVDALLAHGGDVRRHLTTASGPPRRRAMPKRAKPPSRANAARARGPRR